ncbi:MAG: hypothetical protein PHU51_06300 [Candidatus Nanoarchaeia archaeon]|nr:hypothetical protein [Candidatus Nanoarchaeia archaeon]
MIERKTELEIFKEFHTNCQDGNKVWISEDSVNESFIEKQKVRDVFRTTKEEILGVIYECPRNSTDGLNLIKILERVEKELNLGQLKQYGEQGEGAKFRKLLNKCGLSDEKLKDLLLELESRGVYLTLSGFD